MGSLTAEARSCDWLQPLYVPDSVSCRPGRVAGGAGGVVRLRWLFGRQFVRLSRDSCISHGSMHVWLDT